MQSLQGTLFVVATPIGNLQDMSPRMIATLSEVDIIAAEDTRRTRALCTHHGIEHKQIVRCDEIKENLIKAELIEKLASGQSVALVTDAGTPCISDPGWRVVQQAHEQNIRVIPIAGPSAITSALSASGFPATPFTFYGFLDKKKSKAQTTLQSMLESPHTSTFFESPYRIEKTLDQLVELAPMRLIFMIREISKKFEQNYFGTPTQIKSELTTTKGEWTIVISPNHDKFYA